MHWLGARSKLDNDASSEANRRSRGRVRLEGVQSNLGPVLDLSASGMRVLSEQLQQGLIKVTISTFDDNLELPAEIAWCKKIAHRQFMVGLRFLDVTAENQRMLGKIASSHRPGDTA